MRPPLRLGCDVAHGYQQWPPFNAHYDERSFLAIPVFDNAAEFWTRIDLLRHLGQRLLALDAANVLP
ncbi:MAG: hypothetical protein WAK01_18230 [Methylocystis sp.]